MNKRVESPVPPDGRSPILRPLQSWFKLAEHGTSVGKEVLAGATTWVTMVYIVAVNPLMLENAQMDFGAVFVATCLAAAVGSMFMGVLANWPVALAPQSSWRGLRGQCSSGWRGGPLRGLVLRRGRRRAGWRE